MIMETIGTQRSCWSTHTEQEEQEEEQEEQEEEESNNDNKVEDKVRYTASERAYLNHNHNLEDNVDNNNNDEGKSIRREKGKG